MDAEETGGANGMNFWFSQNELTIEDGMFSYGSRSTKFFNYLRREDISTSLKYLRVGKDVEPWPESLYYIGFQID